MLPFPIQSLQKTQVFKFYWVEKVEHFLGTQKPIRLNGPCTRR